ncbi:hypothetical protein J437_LFUL018205 [Ladona fulva]|uniref:PiggyBac transposable element-derived protein domain-containing protein n=1 Tax=Ladona fulva TaxID=123851 RepID=A0A8K0PB62_LADFU|nr:hypothetical protein J437_LFUL018205 [Ladona fulva]
MSYWRFASIRQYLHFNNNEEYDPPNHLNPKLNTIWPIYQMLEDKFSKLYTQERDLTIDESLLLSKGRLGWHQYISQKMARFGIKTYILCEFKSGYVWSTIVYMGKGAILDDTFKNMTSQEVRSLMKPLFEKGCVTTDNFYTSPKFSEALISRSCDTYGTLKRKKLKKGEVAAYQEGKIMVLQWKDKKELTLLSTMHKNEMQTVEKRGMVVRKPNIVVNCNGLDIIEKMIEVYHPCVTSPKVGRPLAGPQPHHLTERHLLDMIPATEKFPSIIIFGNIYICLTAGQHPKGTFRSHKKSGPVGLMG